MSLSVETYILAKKYTDKKFTDYTDSQYKIVDTLPTEDINPHTIYLVPDKSTGEENSYNEFIYVDGVWELIGTTRIRLSDYYTKDEVEQYVEDHKYILPAATNESLGGVIVDGYTLKVAADGMLTVDSDTQEDTVKGIISSEIESIPIDDIEELFS